MVIWGVLVIDESFSLTLLNCIKIKLFCITFTKKWIFHGLYFDFGEVGLLMIMFGGKEIRRIILEINKLKGSIIY